MKLVLTKVTKGMSTAEILTILVSENQTISAISSFAYRHPALLQQRLDLTSDEHAILAKAIALRRESRLPFWDALLLSCFGEQRDFTRLLREATFHQTHEGSML